MEQIQYKEIKSMPDYLIGSNGKIINKTTNKEVQSFTNILGKKAVEINGKEYSIDLLMAFNFNIEGDGYILRYRDNNPDNLNLSNLYWYTPTKEELNELEIELEFEKGNKNIFIINTDGTLREVLDSQIQLANELNVSVTQIFKTIGNYYKRIDGYIFREYNDNVIQEIKQMETRRNNRQRQGNQHKTDIAYICDADGNIKRYVNSYAELAREYNYSNQYWNDIANKLKYNPYIEGYLIPSKKYNQQTINIIKQKEYERINDVRKPRKKRVVTKPIICDRNRKCYIINPDLSIRKQYDRIADIDKEYNRPRYFGNYLRKCLYCGMIDGYIIDVNDWNEETKEIIRQKELKRNKRKIN